MSFMDILKNKKKDDESEFEKQIRLFTEILFTKGDSLDEEKEKLLRNLYEDLNNYFLRGGILSIRFKELIEKDRDNNEKKLYRLFKKLGIKQKNKYATENPNREAFNNYINFKYDSRLTELEPIIKKLKASNTKSLLDSMADSELSILFSSKNKILVLELISRIAILEDDIKEETRLQGSKILSEAKDTLESNFEIIVYLYNALNVMATISKVPRLKVSDRSVRRLQEDLDYMLLENYSDVSFSSLSLPEEKMNLLRNLYRKKLENPQSFRRTQTSSGEGKLVSDENAEQKYNDRVKEFKEDYKKQVKKLSAEIKSLEDVENKFKLYVNIRNRISDSIAGNSEKKDVKRVFEQDAEMENIEEDIKEETEKLKELIVNFVEENKGFSDEDEYSFKNQDKILNFIERKERLKEEIENLMKTYMQLIDKNILSYYKLRLGSDKAEYSQRTKIKETKREQANYPKGRINQDNISEDINELEKVGRDWLANYGLSRTKLELPSSSFGERIDAEKYKKILSEKEPKKPSNPKESSSFIPQRKYTEKDKKGKLVRRKKLPKGISSKKPKYTTEQARYLYSGKPPSKKDKK